MRSHVLLASMDRVVKSLQVLGEKKQFSLGPKEVAMKDSLIKVGGGRQLAYTDLGHPDGTCVFFFQGAPMSRLQLVGLEDPLVAQGLRALTADRPGYGRSSPQPGRSLADWATDVLALADALEIERFLVAGHSSGGPYAVACAALLPKDRLSAALIISGITDMGWAGAWDGFLETESEIMRMPDENAAIAWCVEHFGADGSLFLSAPFDLPEPDDAVLVDPYFEQAMIEAFRQGVAGYAQDIYIQGQPWPFDPRSISIPVHLVHGDSDALLPMAHSRYTAGLITGSTFRTLAGHGHLTVAAELPSLASELVRSLG
jgi:pimeloyl-ACP methyl ester carboxylesterase